MSIIPPIAGLFVAGERPATALDHAASANDDGVAVILNFLGEHYHDRGAAARDAEAYVDLVADIGASDVDACISVETEPGRI